MYSKSRLLIIIVFLVTTFISSCTAVTTEQPGAIVLTPLQVPFTPTPFQPLHYKMYWSPAAPAEWIQNTPDFQITNDPNQAVLSLSISEIQSTPKIYGTFKRIFALGAPFPTTTDEISLPMLKQIWAGNAPVDSEFAKLFMTETTKQTFLEVWGAPNINSIYVVSKEELVSEVWKFSDALAILPFEDIVPRLKILKVDGISPLDRPMDVDQYPLTITYTLSGSETSDSTVQDYISQMLSTIPVTNRDESKITVVVMSGTTALARLTLKKIELNGYEYPIELIKKWFLEADFRHISNEVSFGDKCEFTNSVTMQFCSKSDQIKVFENLGVNVVESTGNHLNDYGTENFVKTLGMFDERGWLVYGGGLNQAAAQAPIRTEKNGNKIAFIGCNPVGFTMGWATADSAGAAKCDFDYFNQQISLLKSEGYVVIATFQFQEIDAPMYDEYYRTDFKVAAESGADIVQGSQAHQPMGFEFVGDRLIHYGLGNFLFDQMEPDNIREFVDRHIIYDGKYISTELLTAKLVDWSRPTPMTADEREKLLSDMFKVSKLR